MPLKLLSPDADRFELDEIDEGNLQPDEEPTTVQIRQATMRQVEERARLSEKQSTVYKDGADEVKIESKFNYPELQKLEVFLTLADCNILDTNGELLFKFKQGRDGIGVLSMNYTEFSAAWGKLKPEWANAIHRRVLKVNPTWGRLADEGE